MIPQAMLPATMKASPPNIRRSVTSGASSNSSRTRSPRPSSNAIDAA